MDRVPRHLPAVRPKGSEPARRRRAVSPYPLYGGRSRVPSVRSGGASAPHHRRARRRPRRRRHHRRLGCELHRARRQPVQHLHRRHADHRLQRVERAVQRPEPEAGRHRSGHRRHREHGQRPGHVQPVDLERRRHRRAARPVRPQGRGLRPLQRLDRAELLRYGHRLQRQGQRSRHRLAGQLRREREAPLQVRRDAPVVDDERLPGQDRLGRVRLGRGGLATDLGHARRAARGSAPPPPAGTAPRASNHARLLLASAPPRRRSADRCRARPRARRPRAGVAGLPALRHHERLDDRHLRPRLARVRPRRADRVAEGRRRHHVRPAGRCRPRRARHAPHRLDPAAVERHARLSHEGRREPSPRPVDVHAEQPHAGAGRVPSSLRGLRARRARRPQPADAPHRDSRAARCALRPRASVARGGRDRRHGAAPSVKSLAVIGTLAALLPASHAVGSSKAAFTAHDEFTASVSTAADWVAPAVTLTTPADDSYTKSTSVTLSGAAGNASGDAATVTVEIYSGTAVTGTPVFTRGVTRTAATWSTTVTTFGQGTYTARATQPYGSGNTGTSAERTFTIDTAAPTRVSIAAANGAGTPGHLDAGDTITYSYSEPMLQSSILASWTGTSAATVRVKFFSGSADAFTVLDSAGAATVKLDAGSTAGGGVSLGGANVVSNIVSFSATLRRSPDGKSFVVTLGSPDIAANVVATRTGAANMRWTPKAGPSDLAGNPLASTAPWTETDADQDF